MSRLKFYIHSPGDESVGIWPINSEVKINDNVVWDKDDIQEFKKFYADMYDTKIESVLTEREFILKEIEAEKDEILSIKSGISDDAFSGGLLEETKRLERLIERCKNKIDASAIYRSFRHVGLSGCFGSLRNCNSTNFLNTTQCICAVTIET